jgi:uncharacterized membrane protein YuzA (DUF378 family)
MEEAPKKSTMTAIADAIWLITALGAINWGLIAFFNFNVIDRLLADHPTRWVYAIIGLCGLAALFLLPLLRVRSTVGRTTAYPGRGP